ncbi:MAG: hypothetical protein AAB401_18605, partial [Acidobacteriota bacterium]
AEARFREAEQMQAKRQPNYPLLYSFAGFRYCDLLLMEAERAAGLRIANRGLQIADLIVACRAVTARAAQTLDWWTNHFTNASPLDIAFDHLTLGRAALYAAILEQSAIRNPQSAIESAVSGLRRAGTQQMIPLALLTRAWLRSLTGARTGSESAQSDLDEAWEIAERGSMKLFLADIHLYRARLFFCEPSYPWQSPQHDLVEAERLINECGYHRRDEELADAKQAILG